MVLDLSKYFDTLNHEILINLLRRNIKDERVVQLIKRYLKRGMKIDIHKRKPILANKIGGYSGPSIMAVALRMVYEVCHSIDVPVIGMGGISTFEDALQFIMAGAEAVAVGTANFHNPYTTVEIIDGIRQYMRENRISSLEEIRGCID